MDGWFSFKSSTARPGCPELTTFELLSPGIGIENDERQTKLFIIGLFVDVGASQLRQPCAGRSRERERELRGSGRRRRQMRSTQVGPRHVSIVSLPTGKLFVCRRLRIHLSFFSFFSTTREKKRRNGKIIELAAADKSPIEEDAAEFAPGTVIPSPLCVLALTRDSTNLASDRLARALLIFLFLLLFLFCLCVPGRWKRPGADLSRFF